MDHAYVEEHDLVEGYLAGRLSEGERDAFEAHYFDCEACIEQLEAANGFRAGMLQAAAEDLAQSTAAARARLGLLAGLAAWSRRSPHLWPALAGALLLLVALLPAFWLAARNRSLERQLAAADAGAEGQRAAAEARLPGPEQAVRPQVNVPLFMLAAVRGGEAADREPVNRIPLSSGTGSSFWPPNWPPSSIPPTAPPCAPREAGRSGKRPACTRTAARPWSCSSRPPCCNPATTD